MEKINAKLLNWASLLEDNTREQAVRTATMPFVEPHLALMPDAHLGLGATVGSVIPTVGAIMPAAVGVDIGCGMIAVRTQYAVGDLPTDRRPLREAIERAVPLSAGAANRKVSREHTGQRLQELTVLAEQAGFDPATYAARWELQLGTLGSGNHFIEVTADELSRVWLFLHSGSRGVGNRIAQRHIKVAQEYCRRHFVELPDRDLAYLVEGTAEFDAYIGQMQWAQHYALLNREEMMDRVVRQLSEWVDGDVERLEEINCHHNYTEREHHLGRDVWLTRKGAINAAAGRDGLIPGSMGTASYVVRGLGNPASFHSAPHGAGRTYSRSAARRTFTHDELRAAMVGIEYRDTDAFIDEIPAAYKDIDQVMADAADLVEIRHTLRQLVNVKGD
ncbi:RtcB family protein [Nocardioides jiangxiensis]|uniref:3'-phosphate/5'-hydroxy nucleic acid ligase n=1 Tax=Nocardioides jiangxiensis TaxID=3064524 RepID=A0ABT9B4X1_9ACTN|nr:RtcB family protein [Nocardioides sp. WY-20]MDO7869445.1 RtcB family protein [Nocardioides sp. WY-20]